MSSNKDKILECFNKFFESNETYTKKELLEFAKKSYDENYKKSKKVVDENAVKKPLNAYQLFMKEQRVILNKRENEKILGEEKKKSTELMKEIAELWKVQKIRIEKKEEIEVEVKEEEEDTNKITKRNKWNKL
jgi:ABC-type uncharacterized transport system fused permease/ATPase subunit